MIESKKQYESAIISREDFVETIEALREVARAADTVIGTEFEANTTVWLSDALKRLPSWIFED